MKKAVSDIYNKTVPDLIQEAKHYVTCMTANPNFVTPDPTLADVTAVVTATETCYEEAKSGTHAKVAELHAQTKNLKQIITLMVVYVNFIAKGDEQIILSAGMKVNKDPEPKGLLPAPRDLRLEKGANEGEVIARFNPVEGAASYDTEYFEAPINPVQQISGQTATTVAGINLGMKLSEIPWKHAAGSTKGKCIISGLSSGDRLLVRVAAVNKHGDGTWSDPATIIVP